MIIILLISCLFGIMISLLAHYEIKAKPAGYMLPSIVNSAFIKGTLSP